MFKILGSQLFFHPDLVQNKLLSRILNTISKNKIFQLYDQINNKQNIQLISTCLYSDSRNQRLKRDIYCQYRQNKLQTLNFYNNNNKLMPKWEINLQPDHHNSSVQRLEQHLKPPFGFTKDCTVSSVQLPRKRDMIEKKLFDLATASKTQIFMTIFMFWMFGNNISIFILFPIIQTLTSALGGIFNMKKVFEPYEGMLPSLGKYKFMYLGINSILLCIVLWKMAAMGMLPVLAADYVDLIPPFDTLKVMSKA